MPLTLAHMLRRASSLRESVDDTESRIRWLREEAKALGLPFDAVFPDGWPVAGRVVTNPAQSGSDETDETRPRYTSPTGQIWRGRGRRPNWLVEALARGCTLEDFVDLALPVAPPVADEPQLADVAVKGATYSDGKGNFWKGSGRRPLWLVSALKDGTALEELRVRSRPGSGLRST